MQWIPDEVIVNLTKRLGWFYNRLKFVISKKLSKVYFLLSRKIPTSNILNFSELNYFVL